MLNDNDYYENLGKFSHLKATAEQYRTNLNYILDNIRRMTEQNIRSDRFKKLPVEDFAILSREAIEKAKQLNETIKIANEYAGKCGQSEISYSDF